jgi:hypothetical protein
MSVLESSVRGRELGRLLRWAQERAGLNGLQLAAKLKWTPTKLSRTLTGFRSPSDTEVATFLGVCGVTGEERDRALRLCHPHEDSSLYLPRDEHWPVYLADARDAVHLVDVQPLVVPWMLQITEYTHALFSEGLMAPEEREERIAARRAAVSLLAIPRVDVLIYEGALRTRVHDDVVTSEQLHHLLRMSVRSSVSVRVVPQGHGVAVGHHGPFTLLGFADCPSVLCREDHYGGALLDEHAVVDMYRSVVEYLNTVALDEQQSRELIGYIATELSPDSNEQFVSLTTVSAQPR